jgi:hypothetical protein
MRQEKKDREKKKSNAKNADRESRTTILCFLSECPAVERYLISRAWFKNVSTIFFSFSSAYHQVGGRFHGVFLDFAVNLNVTQVSSIVHSIQIHEYH